jgi:hypothetical protein
VATSLWAGVEWLRLAEWTDVKGLLEALLTAIAGFLGGFSSTLASNGRARLVGREPPRLVHRPQGP